ncbi:nuclease A inhibitor family protein [Pontibacter silvestris]|uniref:Nuclease A inhibitor family protein n=1 Tax=Pontibacter silvestris TaxID=2305183 RepID=A0ABW4X310_9BACT|nr:nuclease A inhibitor family protein [Pontibacter silvestris]MCC9135111.1 nuclease A inhibitor family protein [Pontibacter silvestris]
MEREELENELTKAADGLWMMSETDAPFEFYYADSSAGEMPVAAWASQEGSNKVEVEELDYFFRNMLKAQPNAAITQQEEVNQFGAMVTKLKSLLQDVKVYRIGEVSVTAYIVGRAENGDIAGYKTLLVET